MGKGPGLYFDIGKKARGYRSIFVLFLIRFFSILRHSMLSIILFGDFNVITVFWLSDLLYKDYQSDHKFTITTYTSTGVVSFYLLQLCWLLDVKFIDYRYSSSFIPFLCFFGSVAGVKTGEKYWYRIQYVFLISKFRIHIGVCYFIFNYGEIIKAKSSACPWLFAKFLRF